MASGNNYVKKTVSEIYGKPTATVIHSRLPIFQASRKVREISQGVWETGWGKVEISGRLGQIHRDLHDIIMTYGEEYQIGDRGDLNILIDPANIKQFMGIKNPNFLDALLEDMRKARVRIEVKGENEKSSLGGIISVVDKEAGEIDGPGGFMQRRNLWTITISRTWMGIYNQMIKVRYAPALPIIMEMKSGFAQAMARFFLTHSKQMNMELSNCLKAIGVAQKEKEVRRSIKSDLSLLEKLGITFDGATIRYQQQNGMVSFENPQKQIG